MIVAPPPFDPRPGLGAILVEVIRAGCYWQAGDLTRTRTTLRKVTAMVAVLRVKLDHEKQADRLGRMR